MNSKRQILKKSFILPLLFILIQCSSTKNDPIITHGPLLGRLTSDGVGVWARTAKPGTFMVRFGKSADSLNELSGTVTTLLENDNTGWVSIGGLDPDTKYYFELVADNKTYTGGSFRTLPDTTLYRDAKLNPEGLFNFSFEFACGNNQTKNDGFGTALPTFRTILDKFADEISFSIQNGDWLYEDYREYSIAQWCEQTNTDSLKMPGLLKIAPSITGVWQNYKGYLQDGPNLAEFHRYVPCFYTYDDHEILNDVIACGEIGYVNRRTLFRDIGVKAWYDYVGWSNPVPFTQPILFGQGTFRKGETLLTDTAAHFTEMDPEQQINLHVLWGTRTAGVNKTVYDVKPIDPNSAVYKIEKTVDDHHLELTPAAKADGVSSYSIGRHSYFKNTIGNCDFFYVDTRGARSLHDHTNRYNPDKSMLGEPQKKWLIDGVTNSKADFIFIVSSVNFMIPHLSGGEKIVDFKDDAWTAFLPEREELIKLFDSKKAPVFVLTADLHNSFAIKITDNVWEFASGPRNSRNHNYIAEGARPATGKFKSFDMDCNIRWSTWFLDDTPNSKLLHPHFCIVQINNVFNSPKEPDGIRYIAFEKPQVIFRYYNGVTGKLVYAEAITAGDED